MDYISLSQNGNLYKIPVESWDKYLVDQEKPTPEAKLFNPALDVNNRNGYDWLDKVTGSNGVVYHPGRDYNRGSGNQDANDPAFAISDCVVTYTGNDGGWGNHIFTKNTINHPKFGEVTVWCHYAHLNKFNVKDGQLVKGGSILGYIGSTGASTATHLHFEIKKQPNGITFYPWGKSKDWVKENYYSPDEFLENAK